VTAPEELPSTKQPGTPPPAPAGEPEPVVELETDANLWPLGLFAGLFPLLMVGFLVSVVANRLVYLAWGLLAGLLYYLVLRRSFVQVWHGARTLGSIALVYAAAAASFGWLGERHFQAFDEGFRAFLWDRYHPLLTAPRSAYLLAAGLGAFGLLAIGWGVLRERRRPVELVP
jgi:hypothetical protein